MSKLPNPEQNEPLDEAAYKHHWSLLKSFHCARPVVHEGLNQFINGLSMNRAGGHIDMTVYLAGKPEGIDSSQIQISRTITADGAGAAAAAKQA